MFEETKLIKNAELWIFLIAYVPLTGIDNDGQPGDINGDGSIDGFDIDDLFDMTGLCRNDLDDSGEIDFNDLLNVLIDFGNTCE